jgi:hypothetical protein
MNERRKCTGMRLGPKWIVREKQSHKCSFHKALEKGDESHNNCEDEVSHVHGIASIEVEYCID